MLESCFSRATAEPALHGSSTTFETGLILAYDFIIKTIEMIIESVAREIKLLLGYLKGKVCIVYGSYFKKSFLFWRELFPRF